jgi:hypothetical protein
VDTTIADAETDVDFPDDVADAWASVLLDLYERRRNPPANESTSTPAKENNQCHAT